jgi:hypothetical protein
MYRAFAVVFAVLFSAAFAAADTINLVDDSAHSTEGLGHFDGSITYTAPTVSGNPGKLDITLTNLLTTAAGGKLTGFAFNINGNATASNLTSDYSSFQLITNVAANPLGTFEVGAALGGNFLGGGSPNPGIARGDTGHFHLDIIGTNSVLAALTADSFLSEAHPTYDFAVRFKGFDNGGSDKVPGIPGQPGDPNNGVPLPSAAVGGIVLLGLLATYKARKILQA